MSQYWEKMFVLHGDENNDSLFITDEKPDFFAPKGLFKIKELITPDCKILDKLSAFYCKENILGNGNMTRVTTSDLEKYLRVGYSVMVYVESKISKEVLGSIMNVLFPIRVKTTLNPKTPLKKTDHYRLVSDTQEPQDLVIAATTFLNNHRKYRGKGLGMVLIQHSLQKAHELGIPCAYFLNSVPRCVNAVEIKCWSYPLNLTKLRQYRINFNRNHTDYYTNLSDPEVLVKPATVLNHSNYLELVKDKKFALYPDIRYWKRWIENFLTYAVYRKKEVIGIFSFFKYTIYIPSCGKEINYANRLICVSRDVEKIKVARAMLAQAQQDGVDMMLLQEVGDLDRDALTQIHASSSKTSDYLNFYNTRIQLSPEDIYAPMI